MKLFNTAAEKTAASDEKRVYTAVRDFFSHTASSRGRDGSTGFEYSITNEPPDLDEKTQIQLSRDPVFKTKVLSIIQEISGLTVRNPHYFITSGTYYTLTMFLTPAQYLQGCQTANQQQEQQITTTTTFSF